MGNEIKDLNQRMREHETKLLTHQAVRSISLDFYELERVFNNSETGKKWVNKTMFKKELKKEMKKHMQALEDEIITNFNYWKK